MDRRKSVGRALSKVRMKGGMCSGLLLPHCNIVSLQCCLQRIRLIYESNLVSRLIQVFFSAGGK